jgi:hypothetical protein
VRWFATRTPVYAGGSLVKRCPSAGGNPPDELTPRSPPEQATASDIADSVTVPFRPPDIFMCQQMGRKEKQPAPRDEEQALSLHRAESDQ